MTEVKLPSAAEWRDMLIGHQFDMLEPALRERGLIAPEPVDPLLVEARELLLGWGYPEPESYRVTQICIALRRGMELARAERPLTREMVWEVLRPRLGDRLSIDDATEIVAALTLETPDA